MNKKRNPRTEFVILRVTKEERNMLVQQSIEDGVTFSVWARVKLGLGRDDGNYGYYTSHILQTDTKNKEE